MKKTTLKNSGDFKNRLVRYSALSVALAGLSEANGQIIYTDIADFTGGATVDYGLDLNNDGTVDFTIDASSANASVFALYLSAPQYSNSFLGSAPNGFAYPFAMNSGDMINAAQITWFDGYATSGTLNFVSCYLGNGGSNWCGVSDKYLGLRFKLGANTHYGWARLDISASGNSFTLKDYAYNSTPGAGLTAGQGTLSIEELTLNKVRIVSLNKSIALYNLPENLDYQLFSVSGQSVLKGNIASDTYVIEASTIATGVYVLELNDLTTNTIIRKKIVL